MRLKEYMLKIFIIYVVSFSISYGIIYYISFLVEYGWEYNLDTLPVLVDFKLTFLTFINCWTWILSIIVFIIILIIMKITQG
jgi:hypothetical protein